MLQRYQRWVDRNVYTLGSRRVHLADVGASSSPSDRRSIDLPRMNDALMNQNTFVMDRPLPLARGLSCPFTRMTGFIFKIRGYQTVPCLCVRSSQLLEKS